MSRFRFDWRWAAVIVVIALLANARSLPWPVTALTLGVPGGYLLSLAWTAWRRSGGWADGNSTTRVTYWRGQRIETPASPRRYRPARHWDDLAPVVVYGLFGVALLLAALTIVLRGLGF
ncbi:MAG: hypothetical protein AB4911_24980 [Oscillochloridaceae bacterium umkhey_bin13]